MAKQKIEIAKARGLYLGYYMAYGAFLPFLNLYFQRIGLNGMQIGVLTAAPVLVTSVGSVVWAVVADTFHIRERILSLALVLTPIPVLLLPWLSSYPSLIAGGLLYAVFSSPIMAILDGSAVEKVKTYSVSFGSIRVWGSIGWTISSWLVGLIIERGDIRTFFYIASALMYLTFFLSLYAPTTATRATPIVRKSIRGFFTLEIGMFLMSVLLVSISMGGGSAFTSIYLSHIGAKEGTIGLGWALSSLSEIPMMFLSGFLLLKFGPKNIIRVAFLLYSIRWLLFSFINIPFWALIVQMLGGVGFAIFLVAGVTHISRLAPSGMGVTAQAIFGTVYFSLGSIIGGLLGGYFYDRVGVFGMFRILSVLALAGFLFFNVAELFRPKAVVEGE